MAQSERLLIENAEILFRNFKGEERQYNAAGDRNFALILPSEVNVEEMQERGWNVKFLRPRDEDEDPRPYIQVKVNFNGPMPPQVTLINSRGRQNLTEDLVEMLDYADIKSVDLAINGSHWEVNGKRGIKAYLHKIFVVINDDELDQKYADVPDVQQASDDRGGPRFQESNDDWS